METVTEKLYDKLRKLNPSKVRAIAGDEIREIAVPERRKKWSQVIEAVTAGAWHRCELLNKRGEVLGYVDNTAPASDLEDFADNRKRSEVQWIVELVVRAQRDALAYRDSEVQALLQAQGQVVRELSAGVRDVAALYREQAVAARDLGAMQAGQGDILDELLKAAPELLKVLPMVRSLLSGDPSSTASNGAKGKPHA
jgi:hypothetical protein